MSMLSEILATKRTEVAYRAEHTPLQLLQERLIDAPPPRDFVKALRQLPGPTLIAEVKKASPSKGVIRADFDPIAIAKAYEANGAACLSVLTDEPYFQGKLDYLTSIREVVSLPLLRKDFIIDPWQIAESRAAGADAILLIVAALSPCLLRDLLHLSQEYGMAALVEVHDREELHEALDAGASLIGINNRDLHTFQTSLNVTFDLLAELPPDPNRTIVSESGIFTHDDVLRLGQAGVHSVLIGEALMREADVGAKVREILGR
ncbi:indole-3-glycerol phosphate synthase [Chthonomonas calidirosea]|uniref:Indole-3-glycerol phosphate synthase n=1 Tax=Chthonomonas calidirosea (strain DSM 23976 / ICMP 18418 / T49) TaxID=1303518 RepID=S0EY07_CHTCT|nr:indole-3-glycerol phosphate synthase TrpC [Chthonomonas calidirosea]CCW36594.1 indole-3-glycerol phosphate synthase [Chthonomonas calidirosea T49]CEK15764.1 indole-3-glycerol phosphate synthase [Chthonomonas calidirosea]CEK15772.1 indole-3-glycerol phosphate synthase [Chthonomonas calidirosea]CEK16865.1 indole-3-glycerol phosphate synthase [Chthonomonas calidirosea]